MKLGKRHKPVSFKREGGKQIGYENEYEIEREDIEPKQV